MAIRVVTVAPSGQGWDLTDQAEGLRYSNVNPGGDERCTFELKRQWFTGAPEIAQGNTVRVTDGLDVLWQGRVDENDRQVKNAEAIGVTAYGSGMALKDDGYAEIYADASLTAWGPRTTARRIALLAAVGAALRMFDSSVQPDADGFPAVRTQMAGPWGYANSEALYAPPNGLKIAALYYDFVARNHTPTGATWGVNIEASDNGDMSASDGSGDIGAASASGYFTPATARRYMHLRHDYNAAYAGTEGYWIDWRKLTAYGTHGLTRRGSDPGGFYTSDLVRNVISRASGVTARTIDGLTTILRHLVNTDGLMFEDWIREISKYELVDWGTWGPDSVLDTYTGGYFDWRSRDTATQHWYALRSECDDVALTTELATLYDGVDVAYTDTAGRSQIETRTRTVPLLSSLGFNRKPPQPLQGGRLTQAGAQTLGDTFLALNSGDPPARGTIRISKPIAHYRRGVLPAHYLRANGSNIRVPDVLPSKDALSLAAAPDQRTTFPIKRVDVDCSGAWPVATAAVDQTDDRLAVLQAHLNHATAVLNL